MEQTCFFFNQQKNLLKLNLMTEKLFSAEQQNQPEMSQRRVANASNPASCQSVAANSRPQTGRQINCCGVKMTHKGGISAQPNPKLHSHQTSKANSKKVDLPHWGLASAVAPPRGG